MTKSVKTIATLLVGEVLLASARKVEGGKIQLEFAERIANPSQGTNVLAAMNADDDRFSQSLPGARRVYLTASPAMVQEHFGVDVSKITTEPTELNILNPKLMGKALRIQVSESFKGTEYQMANAQKAAKQFTNKDGETKYFIKDGDLIFSNTKLVDVEPKHTIIASDAQVSWEEYTASKVTASASVEDALN